MLLQNKTYDFLKWLFSQVLPAIFTAFSTIAVATNHFYGTNIPVEYITIVFGAIMTAIGVILGISTKNYNKLTSGAELPHEEGTDGSEL